MEFIQQFKILTQSLLLMTILSFSAFAIGFNENNFCDRNNYLDDFYKFTKTSYCDLNSSTWQDKCQSISCGNTIAIQECLSQELKACTKVLNESFKNALKEALIRDGDYPGKINQEKGLQSERLKNSHKSWDKFKDDNCLVGVDFSGSAGILDVLSCHLDLTKYRIKNFPGWLKRLD